MFANSRALIGMALSIVPLLSTPALAQKISYDYRTHESFGSIKTFAFKQTEPPDTITHKTTTYDSPLIAERTKVAVAAELTRRGLTQDDQNPDVYVSTLWTYKPEYVTYGSNWGGYPWGYGWGGWGP